jgi:hypothetical protein
MVVLWAMLVCTTDRTRLMRSLPLIGAFTFLSVAIPDVASAVWARPEGKYAVPGGNGLADGLVLKSLMGIAMMWLAYQLKLWRARIKGLRYDQASRDFLLNASPRYRRDSDRWEGQLSYLETQSA